MNLFHYFRAAVLDAVAGLVAAGVLPDGLDLAAVAVEPPRDPSHGDLATNAALVLARAAKARPRDLADQLVARLKTHPAIAVLDVAGPGFINFRLAPAFWHARLADILVAGPHYGDTDLGRGRAVNVEYVSANPTGPMHVGHGRGAVIGDALANLLEKAGFRVTREYYINDAGAQVDMLARSAHLRYREALGETISAIPEGLYPGDYLKPVGAALAAAHGARFQGKPESEWLELFRSAAVDAMMALIRADLVALGVRHAVFTSERALHQKGAVEEAVAVLEAKDLVYTGVLEPPKGMKLDDWEPRPQTLFRSTRFGDDVDRPLRKSDGSWTYFAGDIAYHLDKVRRGSRLLIDVWGADHGGYVKRMQAAVTALTGGEAVLDVKLCQLVNLLEKGEPVKMSKRAGTFVTLRDVVDQVGKDVVRFIMLTRKNDAALDFDLARVVEQSRDNPVFYVQYAHARARSVLRHAAAAMPNEDLSAVALARADAALLDDPDEIGLIRHMAAWPRIVEAAAESHEPHRIAFYLNDLAAAFHGLWNRGKDEAALRFIRADAQDLTRARLALVQATALVIAAGLGVFAVKPVEEMR